MSSPRNIRLTELDGVRCCWTELKTAPILFFICQLINQSMRGVSLVDLHSFLYRLYACVAVGVLEFALPGFLVQEMFPFESPIPFVDLLRGFLATFVQ